jgi:DNA-binding transcriptional ArsR family regulator
MARKIVSRALAPLPDPRSLAATQHKSDALTEILRHVAVKTQQEQPRTFYSVREIALQFGVPVSTVSRVYRRLEEEGLLSTVRGSKTMLQGLHFDRQLSVRAFIGLPASLSSFLTIQDYRMFFIRIRRELRLRGFATAMLFHEGGEEERPAFSARLKAYQVDTVLWFEPPKSARESVLRLLDAGVRIIGVTETSCAFLKCRYRLSRSAAVKQLLDAWKTEHAIENVTLVESSDFPPSPSEETLRRVLDDLKLPRQASKFATQSFERFLRNLMKANTARTGIIFPSSRLASMFCFRAPDTVSRLLAARHVAFTDGPVNMPFARVPSVRVDLITHDWKALVQTIVDDLITQNAFRATGSITFEAQCHLGVPLSRFAQDVSAGRTANAAAAMM